MENKVGSAPQYGRAERLAPKLRRIVAPNPSPMTYHGTNTYLLGERGIAVIDPGPDDTAHLDAILGALTSGQFISHIIVTHAHLDHAALSGRLSQASGAPVYAFGAATTGRSKAMIRLIESGYVGGGEGVDTSFYPHKTLANGQKIHGDDWDMHVIHTPGHIGNHICLEWNDCCFTADHIMGWASSLVSPPDGDLTDFMLSCRRLRQKKWNVFYPGHGDPITEPNARVDWLISHRQDRESALLAELSNGPLNARDLTRRIYQDTPSKLLPAAQRNVLAHLIDLTGRSRVEHSGQLFEDTVFALAQNQTE